jgi:RNA polymerase-binding transcription factor DksA
MSDVPALTLCNRRALRAAVLEEIDRSDHQIESLSRSFQDIVEAAMLVSTDDEHDPEGTTIAFERAQVSALLQQATADRAALRVTLDRIEDPGYGVCDVCKEFIGVERLLALPATNLCIRCAS